jgi:phage/plasmid-associated DNA primase
LFNRTLVLEFKRVFTPDEAVSTARELGVEGPSIGQWLIEKEGPGILNEALAGRERLLRRGRYERPPVIAGALREFRKATSIVSDFLEAAAVREASGRLPRADLLHAFHGYEIDQNGKKARQTAARSFWHRLRKAAVWCDPDGYMDTHGVRHVTGIGLNEEGRRLLLVGENEG